jgi:energy-coupling factor transporter ATP-binding protein EcfA2
MHVSRVYLRWYKSFNIDYTGTAGGDRVPAKRPWNNWTLNKSTVELPFVEIPLERDITTIVGANESGKSQLLSAISSVLEGRGIPADPFSSKDAQGRQFSETDLCHFALPLTKEANLWPQIGLEFMGLSREEYKELTNVEPPRVDPSLAARVFLAPGPDGAVASVFHAHSDEPRRLSQEELTAVRGYFPRKHFINSQLPFADEIHLADLLRAYGETAEDPEPFYDSQLAQTILKKLAKLTIAPASPDGKNPVLDELKEWQQDAIASTKRRAQELRLEVQLFRDVLGIPRDAIKKVYSLGTDDAAHAAAIVKEWEEELERVLNLSRYWQQDQDFSIKLWHHRHTISFQITDKTQRIYTFRERSSGLRYFLSYYIQAKAIEQASAEKSHIVLMDEPDSFLSIAGQRNLLAVFESLVRQRSGRELQELFPNAVDGRDNLSGDSFSVDEHDAVDQVF